MFGQMYREYFQGEIYVYVCKMYIDRMSLLALSSLITNLLETFKFWNRCGKTLQ